MARNVPLAVKAPPAFLETTIFVAASVMALSAFSSYHLLTKVFFATAWLVQIL
jgi:hypothetical protein